MDYTDKIKRFGLLEELTAEIEKDLTSTETLARRYGVRFIILDNFDTFKKLAVELSKLNVKTLDLDDLLDSEDGWITTDMLKNQIFTVESSTLVTPFSELARFYTEAEFRGFFNEIILSEQFMQNNIRVYFPLIGLKNRFTDFLQHFGRIQESAPIWQLSTGDQQVKVYSTKPDMFKFADIDSKSTIKNMREWLKFWKTAAPQDKVICYSRVIKAMSKYSVPDNIFSFENIDSSYKYITSYWEKSIPIEYTPKEDKYWDHLLEVMGSQILEKFNFDGFVKKHFNKQDFDVDAVLEEWGNEGRDAFDRWLLKSYLRHSQKAQLSPYFERCLNDCVDYDLPSSLYKEIATSIFYMGPGEQERYLTDRKNIVCSHSDLFNEMVPEASQEWMCEQVVSLHQTRGDVNFSTHICTGAFHFEKVLALQWYGELDKEVFGVKRLKEIYPEMEFYLDKRMPKEFTENQCWVLDYMQAYKDAKIQDEYTDEISVLIEQQNHDSSAFYKWYHAFSNSLSTLVEKQGKSLQKPDKVYWIDGLGAEYFAFMVNLLESMHSNFKIVASSITRANIPSETELNKPSTGHITKKFPGMDQIGHDSGMYKKYETLVRELVELESNIREIVRNNESERCTIAIYSDHGMSCLSRKVESKKFKAKTEHEGRFVEVDCNVSGDSNDFIFHQNEVDGKTYQIALKHASIGNKPTHEVHGGCTPEEVLVPFIIISNREDKQDYQFIVKSEDSVALSDGKIRVVIKPDPGYATLEMDGRSFDMIKTPGNIWETKIDDMKEHTYKYRIYAGNGDPFEGTVSFFGMKFQNADDDFNF